MKTIEPYIPLDVQRSVESELRYQGVKWPNHQHSVAEWLLILEKLMEDARKAWVTKSGDLDAMNEVRQIVATGISCMIQCGAPMRPFKDPSPVSLENVLAQAPACDNQNQNTDEH